jgi:hypothetical protein
MKLRVTYENVMTRQAMGEDVMRQEVEVNLEIDPTTQIVSAKASLEALQDLVYLANSGSIRRAHWSLEGI